MQTDSERPWYPQVSERADYDLVTMPAEWPLEPLYEQLAVEGRTVIKEKKAHGLWRIRVSKRPDPGDGGEPTEAPAAVAA